jgi:hypothetical protein
VIVFSLHASPIRMDWYVVIKTINGHRYRQKTWRDGKRVRTRSEYIGPAGECDLADRPDRSPISPPVIDSKEALDTLVNTDCAAIKWRQSWSKDRKGLNVVSRSEPIEQALTTLQVVRSSLPIGCFYNPGRDTLNMPTPELFRNSRHESATSAYYTTLLHELVHWTGFSGRLIPVP